MKAYKKMLLGISLLLFGNTIGTIGGFFLYIEWIIAAIGFFFVLAGFLSGE